MSKKNPNSTQFRFIKMAEVRAKRCAETFPSRFWVRVLKTENITDCWPWHYCPKWWNGRKLYPMVSARHISNMPIPAHRVAFFLHNGHLPKEGQICHRCGNHICCNPHHLYHGTAKQNHLDAVAHGTFRPLETKYGEAVYNAKLTMETVLLIRKIFPVLAKNEKSELAKIIGISRPHLRRVAIGEGWGHVQATK